MDLEKNAEDGRRRLHKMEGAVFALVRHVKMGSMPSEEKQPEKEKILKMIIMIIMRRGEEEEEEDNDDKDEARGVRMER